jgi:lycopene elongase/hydratase (dihydrobisanhydrobacterioruberin-forming)
VTERPSATTPARRAGYHLLGNGFDYLLHLRPAEWPIMAAHTALGWLLAVGVSGAVNGVQLGEALFALLVWVVFLNGGTLAINSAFDRDEGDIGYLKAPPPPPRHLLAFSLVLLVGGQLLALRLPVGFQVAYAICFFLSLVYSVPPLRLKAVAGRTG